MKDAYYFSHDSNARNDPKVLLLRSQLGWEGYGLYFAVLELMRDEESYMLPNSAKDTLQLSLSIDKDKVCTFLSVCLDIKLFIDDGSYIYSESFKKRMELMDEKRNKKVEAGRKGGCAKAKAKQRRSKPLAKCSKVKESKVKESKGKVYTLPSIEDVKKYFGDNGFSEGVGENAFHFYAENEWKDSNGKKVKNWKQKMRGVWFKEENKVNQPEQDDQFPGMI